MFLNDDDMVECPYNKSHRMLRKRLQSHLLKCRLSYPDVELRKCPFNITHLVPEPEFTHHATNCPDRKLITQYKYDAPEMKQEEAPKHAPIECDEDWDDTDVADYDPQQYVEHANVIRKPEGSNPSCRRIFIKQERKRLGDEDDDEDDDTDAKNSAIGSSSSFNENGNVNSEEGEANLPKAKRPLVNCYRYATSNQSSRSNDTTNLSSRSNWNATSTSYNDFSRRDDRFASSSTSSSKRRSRSPINRSNRDRSPNNRSNRDRSPNNRSNRDCSPINRSNRDGSPNNRSYRDRSPLRGSPDYSLRYSPPPNAVRRTLATYNPDEDPYYNGGGSSSSRATRIDSGAYYNRSSESSPPRLHEEPPAMISYPSRSNFRRYPPAPSNN